MLKRSSFSFLRASQKASLNFVQKSLRLDRLNERELVGNYRKTSHLKLVKFSQQLLPLNLGRSIRGEAFNQSMIDPFALSFSKLELGKPISIIAFQKTLYEY